MIFLTKLDASLRGDLGGAPRLTRSQAHLTGLFVGSAYYYFDGKNNVWVPLRQLLEKERVVAEPIATDHSEALDSGKPIEPSKVTETPKVTESPEEPSKGKMAEEK